MRRVGSYIFTETKYFRELPYSRYDFTKDFIGTAPLHESNRTKWKGTLINFYGLGPDSSRAEQSNEHIPHLPTVTWLLYQKSYNLYVKVNNFWWPPPVFGVQGLDTHSLCHTQWRDKTLPAPPPTGVYFMTKMVTVHRLFGAVVAVVERRETVCQRAVQLAGFVLQRVRIQRRILRNQINISMFIDDDF